MLTERTPIERFVYQKINMPRIKKTIEPLNLDPELLLRNLVKAFVDMGIFMVRPGQDGIVEIAIMDEIKRIAASAKGSKAPTKPPKHGG